MNLLNILSFILAVIAYGLKELQSHGKLKWMQHGNYVRTFWDEDSYLRKYKLTNRSTVIPAPNNWYYRSFKIKYKERFPLSATALVFLTDGYHLCQAIFKCFLILTLVTYEPIFNMVWDFIGYFALWGLIFTVTYNLLSK